MLAAYCLHRVRISDGFTHLVRPASQFKKNLDGSYGWTGEPTGPHSGKPIQHSEPIKPSPFSVPRYPPRPNDVASGPYGFGFYNDANGSLQAAGSRAVVGDSMRSGDEKAFKAPMRSPLF